MEISKIWINFLFLLFPPELPRRTQTKRNENFQFEISECWECIIKDIPISIVLKSVFPKHYHIYNFDQHRQ